MTLPLASRILMGISAFVQGIGWWLIPLVMIATPFVLVHVYKTRGGKSVMDRIALADADLRQALPDARYHAVCPHALGLARCGGRRWQLDRSDRRCAADDPDPKGGSLGASADHRRPRAERDRSTARGNSHPTSSRSSAPEKKPASFPRASCISPTITTSKSR